MKNSHAGEDQTEMENALEMIANLILFIHIYVNIKGYMFVNIFSLGLLMKGGEVASVFIVRKEIHSHMKSHGTFSLGNIKIDIMKCLSQTERQLINFRKHVS